MADAESCFNRHVRAPTLCADVKYPIENQPMDGTVQMNLRAALGMKIGGRPKKGAEPPPPLDDCTYYGQQTSEAGDSLVKCVSYVEVSNPKEATWYKDHQHKLCGKTVHLSCVRKAVGAFPGDTSYKGSIPLAEAQRNVISFCPDCFHRTGATRPDGDDAPDADGRPAGGQAA